MRKDSKILTDIGGFRLSVRRPAAGRRLPACALVLCIASFLLSTSCQRKEILMPEYNAVVTILDGSSTRAIPEDSDPQINDIAIFAFSGQDLVGYIYESGLAASGKTIFPMTLTKGGSIDFYVIANSEPGFFKVVDQNDGVVNWSGTSTVNPPTNVTPDYLEACKVKLGDRNASDSGPWYAPMTNLPGAGGGNRTFDVDGMTRIPIELTRAVSKVEVWFRTRGDQTKEPESTVSRDFSRPQNNPQSQAPKPVDTRRYYSIEGMSLSIPVKASGLVLEDIVYYAAPDGPFVVENTERYYYGNTFGTGFPDYDPDELPDNFYSEDYFYRIWEYYIFPNLYGGNTAGESTGSDTENCTSIVVDYAFWQEEGQYVYNDKWESSGWGWNTTYIYYYDWESKFVKDEYSIGTKTIYLPPVERNTCINVWCALNDDTDRSFTYTVSDWDETVTVNVPDFN